MTARWILAVAGASVVLATVSACVARAAPAKEPAIAYPVRPRDTLHDLALRYLVRPSAAGEVQRLNRIADPRRLPIGRRLTIPARLLRTEPIVARLIAYSGQVAVSGPGAEPLRRDMAIREGYELSTGANAFLTFELPDGSRTTLPSQSRIRVERLRRVLINGALERDLRLEQGRSKSVVTPMTAPGSRFHIRTPITLSAVRGTEFRVNHDAAAGRSTVEVIEGQVAGASAATESVVTAGFGLAATGQGLSAPQALLPPPRLADPARPQDEPQLTFELAPQANAVGYRAQIANDAGFIDILAEASSVQSRLMFETLANGTYFVRLTAIDGSGLEGLPADYAFERRLNVLGLDTPAAVAGARRQYLFKWRSTGGAPESFRFVLARDANGENAVVDEVGLADRQIVVTDLPPGIYYWKVLVSRSENGRLYEKWSAPQRFEIGG